MAYALNLVQPEQEPRAGVHWAFMLGSKRHEAEEMAIELRHLEGDLGKGTSVAAVCKLLGVTEQI